MTSRIMASLIIAGSSLVYAHAAYARDLAATAGQDAPASTAVQASAVQAEAAPAPLAAIADESRSGEIVVTAQRRSQSLMDTPVSVTVVDQKTLISAGITSTRDLERITPSLQMQAYGGWLQPSLRGISSKGASPGDSSNVAVYIDGVYQPNQASQLFDLPDVSRVEVLKGPQGSLYGQNAAGGAIIITTQNPTSTLSGRVYGGYGNYDDVVGGGFLSGPITSNLSASLAAQYEDHDGFRHNVVTGDHDFGLHSALVRGKLRYEASDSASFTLTGLYSTRKDSLLFAGLALDGNSVGYGFHPELPVLSGNDETGTTDAFSKFVTYQVSLRGQFRLGEGTLGTVSSFGRVKVSQSADIDYTPAVYGASTPNPRQSTFIQEINYVADKQGRFSWLGGLFYMHSEDGYPGTGAFYLYPPANVPPTPSGPPAVIAPYIGTLQKDAGAAYLELSYDLLDHLSITAGGRYSYERQRGFAAFSFDGSHPPATEYAGGPQTYKKFTPRVSAVYRPSDDTSIYATYSRGFKSGLINILSLEAVKPENVTGYELGFRARKPGIGFAELSLYRYDYKDLQVSAFNPSTNVYLYENAAAARINGVELTLEATPTKNLTLTAGGSYLNAKYVDYQGKPVILTVFVPNGTNTGNDQVALDVTGRQVERAPRFVGNLSARYTIPTSAGDISLFGTIYHNSGYSIEASGRVAQGEFNTVDAELSFSPIALRGGRISLWGRNLTDRAYIQSGLVTTFADGVTYAPPRTYGVRLEYSF